MDNELKQCSKCKEYKERDLFHNHKSTKDGKRCYCKSCLAEKASAYRKANPEKFAERNRAYQKANPEKVAAKNRAWKKANPEKVAESSRAYRKAHPEKVAARQRAYNKANPEQHMLWRAKNRAKNNNLEFNLTIEDLHIPERCPILGITLERGNGDAYKDSSPSLDKIYPDKGYTKGNVHVVSNRFNILKRDATFDELILMGKWAEQFTETA